MALYVILTWLWERHKDAVCGDCCYDFGRTRKSDEQELHGGGAEGLGRGSSDRSRKEEDRAEREKLIQIEEFGYAMRELRQRSRPRFLSD